MKLERNNTTEVIEVKIMLFAENAHPSKQGGIETFGRILKKMFKDNLYCLAYEASKKKDSHKVDDIIEIPCKGFYKYINKLTKQGFREYLMKKKLINLDYDITIFNYPRHINFFKNMKDKKKILVQHASYNDYLKRKEFFHNDKDLINLILKDLDYFVFLSEYDKKTFIEKLNLDRAKAKVIRHSSEMPLLTAKKEKSKKLIMIARLENNQKRFDLVIKAMKKLADFSLDIYGSGDKGAIFLNELIKKENINNVKVHGPTNQVQEKLDNAAIFVMTSDYEGYPIALIEAIRRGLPLIVRETFDATKDIVIDNGVLLQKEWNEDEFVEGIRKIYDNYEYYSENSKKMGERHSFEVIKKEWENLFSEIRNKGV
ncbi:glycosyltransferase [Fusobacterium russii]|uniref:glycosyltransferase n=1 Tax=Fusobacterium russii TaxID=854 RepID=UPI0003B316CE|nr:glycosyltransferase [Fusobacterium russii]